MVVALLDGLEVLLRHAAGIAGFFMAVLGIGALSLRLMAANVLSRGLRMLLAPAVGLVALSLLCFAIVVGGYRFAAILGVGSYLILVLGLAGLSLELLPRPHATGPRWRFGVLIFSGLGVLLVVRLIFLQHILVPPYSDSVIHYQIVQDLLQPGTGSELNISLQNLPDRYYHLGFHALAAWYSTWTGTDPLIAMPLLGQLMLVIAPVSLGMLAFALTRDFKAGLFAGLIGTLGWALPAFAVNWGKYPALAALISLPGLLAAFSLSWRGGAGTSRLLATGLCLMAGVALLHTRILAVILLAGTAMWLTAKAGVDEELPLAQAMRFSVFYLITLAPFYSLLAEFYAGLAVTAVFVVLLPLAFRYLPRVSLGAALFTFEVWAIKLLSILLPERVPALLNDQFIEILLYGPFALLAGAGFAGLWNRWPANPRWRWAAAGLPVALVLGQFALGPTIYPDSCCEYYDADDKTAFGWISANTIDRSLFLTAAFQSGGQYFGTDGGIWISPLIVRASNRYAFDTDWSAAGTLEELCGPGAGELYIYSGGREFSFDNARLRQVVWAEAVFESGHIVIYRVTGCED